jgi:hypothetical protein
MTRHIQTNVSFCIRCGLSLACWRLERAKQIKTPILQGDIDLLCHPRSTLSQTSLHPLRTTTVPAPQEVTFPDSRHQLVSRRNTLILSRSSSWVSLRHFRHANDRALSLSNNHTVMLACVAWSAHEVITPLNGESFFERTGEPGNPWASGALPRMMIGGK